MAHDHSDGCEACVPLDEMDLAEELAALRDYEYAGGLTMSEMEDEIVGLMSTD